ncbi:pyridoxamine 5'-phosphate oxidase family protein [Oscillospiraceae bacterium MB08-C2-2]|nr:pyridoxamine 5'-phosphate oxidase family protein [Oscillospiraceae bacterium MB08-C2-2]
MKRFQLTEKQVEELLHRAEVGRLGTIGEDGYPYVIAMHFVYHKGSIYMHGLPKGQKIDNIQKYPKVCFEVDELLGLQIDADGKACNTEAVYNSAVIRGTARILEEIESKREVLGKLVEKYTPQFAGQELPENMVKGTAVIEIRIDTSTGKYHS